MEFHDTVYGKQFFGTQFPRLVTALTDIAAAMKAPKPVFRLEQEVPPDFLKDLYYGWCDPSERADSTVFHEHNVNIIAHQDKMRKILTPEAWDAVEQYRTLLDARGAAEREQAFAAGFQFATSLFAAGLSAPPGKDQTN